MATLLDYTALVNQVWSAADGRIYSASDDALIASSGASMLPWPVDIDGAQTNAALYAILAPFGLGASLNPAATQEQLASRLVAAARDASNAITSQIASTQTHLAGYQSATNMVRAANGVPATDPD